MPSIKRGSLTKINYCDCGSDSFKSSLIQSNLWQVRCTKCHNVLTYLNCNDMDRIKIIRKMTL